MQKQAARKMKMTSFTARRKLVKKLVKRAVSRVSMRKVMKAKADHEVIQEHAEGGMVPGSFGMILNGKFVPLTSGFLVNSAAVPYCLPVVDNHGFLLGEFSKLDALSLCLEDEWNDYSDQS